MNEAAGTAFLTGATGGLGRALVAEFQQAGWRLALLARRPAHGGELRFEADVRDETAVREAMDTAAARFGRLDVLIHAAGCVADHTIGKLEGAEWDQVLDVNLKSAFLCSKAALRHMLRHRSGHIILIGSWAARHGNFGQANYAAAKAGLIALTQSLAREYGRRGIQANCVLPGFMHTPMTAHLPPQRVQEILAQNTLGRASDPADAARFIRFLITLKNVSGQIFQLDSRIAPWT